MEIVAQWTAFQPMSTITPMALLFGEKKEFLALATTRKFIVWKKDVLYFDNFAIDQNAETEITALCEWGISVYIFCYDHVAHSILIYSWKDKRDAADLCRQFSSSRPICRARVSTTMHPFIICFPNGEFARHLLFNPLSKGCYQTIAFEEPQRDHHLYSTAATSSLRDGDDIFWWFEHTVIGSCSKIEWRMDFSTNVLFLLISPKLVYVICVDGQITCLRRFHRNNNNKKE